MPDQPGDLYPLLLDPVLHTRVWGSQRLHTQLGKTLPSADPYGESWEMHDTARVANGPLAGQRLGDLLTRYGAALTGAGFDPAQGLPLLVKLLDASDWLSVQVHPNDAQALALEGDPRGKTEAWIILAAEPGARLVIGVQPGTSRAVLADAIETGALEPLLVYAEVQAGDVLFIEANTIHAIGPGLLLYEIQQSSDVTYRLYDWNRLGLDGKPRPLHIEKGVQVSNVESLPTLTHPLGEDALLVECAYFQTTRLTLLEQSRTLETGGVFQALTCIDGALTLTHGEITVTLQRGQTVFIPAALEAYVVVGSGVLLCSAPSVVEN